MTGLAVLAGGFGIAAFATTVWFLTLRNEAQAPGDAREGASQD